MEQTAVGFLIGAFVRHFGAGWLADETIKKEIEQANKIFEKQIEDAWFDGWIERSETSKLYYHKTFKQQENENRMD